MSQEIKLYDNIQNPIEAAARMGEMMAKSGLFGIEKTETGQVLALACMAERISPFEFSRRYHIIKGRISMRADQMLARFRSMGGKVKWTRFDGEAAVGEWTYDGQTTTIGYILDDAKMAQLLRDDSTWKKDPGAMLRARCVSKAIRMIAPEVIAGYSTPEEVGDEIASEPVKSFLPAQPVVTTTPPAPEPKAIEVTVTPVTDPTPTTTPTPTAPAPTEKFTAKAGSDGKGIDVETHDKILSLVEGLETQALSWMTAKKYIQDGKLITLKRDIAQLFIEKPDKLVEHIKKHKV